MSKEKLVVRPKKNSLTITPESTEYYVAGHVGGRFRRKTIGAVELDRWEGSQQLEVPMFDKKLRKFALRKEDGSYYSVQEARQFPKKFPLSYDEKQLTKGDSRVGQPIEYCNIADADDPYMNHPMFHMSSKEGELSVDPNDTYYEIKSAAIRGNREIMSASASDLHAANTRSILSDQETDKQIKQSKRRAKMSAYNLLSNMSLKKRIAILSALGNDVDENTDPDVIEEALFSYVDDPVTTEEGMTRQQLFVKYANMDMEELLLKQTLRYAYRNQIIIQRRGVYMFENTQIGTSWESVEDFFKNADNYNRFETLEMYVSEKKKQKQGLLNQDINTDYPIGLDEEE